MKNTDIHKKYMYIFATFHFLVHLKLMMPAIEMLDPWESYQHANINGRMYIKTSQAIFTCIRIRSINSFTHYCCTLVFGCACLLSLTCFAICSKRMSSMEDVFDDGTCLEDAADFVRDAHSHLCNMRHALTQISKDGESHTHIHTI